LVCAEMKKGRGVPKTTAMNTRGQNRQYGKEMGKDDLGGKRQWDTVRLSFGMGTRGESVRPGMTPRRESSGGLEERKARYAPSGTGI